MIDPYNKNSACAMTKVQGEKKIVWVRYLVIVYDIMFLLNQCMLSCMSLLEYWSHVNAKLEGNFPPANFMSF